MTWKLLRKALKRPFVLHLFFFSAADRGLYTLCLIPNLSRRRGKALVAPGWKDGIVTGASSCESCEGTGFPEAGVITCNNVGLCPSANFPEHVVDSLPADLPTGIYYGWASVGSGDVHKMVVSIGWNPYYKNVKKSMVRGGVGSATDDAMMESTRGGLHRRVLAGHFAIAVIETLALRLERFRSEVCGLLFSIILVSAFCLFGSTSDSLVVCKSPMMLLDPL